MIGAVTAHWLSFAAGIFLVAMMLCGHYRGFLRQCLSLGALVLTVITVRAATPYMAALLQNNPEIRETVVQVFLDAQVWEDAKEVSDTLASSQTEFIESLDLPDAVKEALLENNNSDVYELLGVDEFAEYISAYLADMVIRAVISGVLFIASYLVIQIVIHWLDLFSRLPILSGLNQIAGAVLGIIQGLLFLWIAGLVVYVFRGTSLGSMLEEQILASGWLSFIYRRNLIAILISAVVTQVF